MNGLADVFRGDRPAGVYRSDLDPDRIGRAAVDAGWAVAVLDGAGIATKAALLSAVGGALSFPAWYGGNWDALADCLSDLSWLADRGELLIWRDYGVLADDDFDSWRIAYQVFASARSPVPLAVVLTGAGPTDSPVDGSPIPLL
ncbi:MAG TPA: barstar family protein [Micromonosporaceae bacterium]